jgi:thiol:disulfide interchange protein
MDAYASWCGPCKKMDKMVFTQAEVGEVYNSTFINTKFDMEKGEGVGMAKNMV